MLKCEGYMMFRGTAEVVPKTNMPRFAVTGDWLYKPEYDCWYVNGSSYPAEVIDIENRKEEVG